MTHIRFNTADLNMLWMVRIWPGDMAKEFKLAQETVRETDKFLDLPPEDDSLLYNMLYDPNKALVLYAPRFAYEPLISGAIKNEF